jgi:hypothetical protein
MTDWPDVRGRLTQGRALAELTWLRVGGPADVLFSPLMWTIFVRFSRPCLLRHSCSQWVSVAI